jgi:hypothetical protein
MEISLNEYAKEKLHFLEFISSTHRIFAGGKDGDDGSLTLSEVVTPLDEFGILLGHSSLYVF